MLSLSWLICGFTYVRKKQLIVAATLHKCTIYTQKNKTQTNLLIQYWLRRQDIPHCVVVDVFLTYRIHSLVSRISVMIKEVEYLFKKYYQSNCKNHMLVFTIVPYFSSGTRFSKPFSMTNYKKISDKSAENQSEARISVAYNKTVICHWYVKFGEMGPGLNPKW